MNLGPHLKMYENDIRNAVYEYAVSNYHIPPILEELSIDWAGEIFEVANIDKELHEDLIIDLKNLDLYDKIKEECDKFVILPDVWSKSPMPITAPFYPRNEYDSDRRNIVFVNGKILELQDVKMKHTFYNHNKHYYCFYNSTKSDGIFESENPSMKVIFLYDHGFVIDDINENLELWNEISTDKGRYKFTLDINGNISETETTDRLGVVINYEYQVFDYDEVVDDRKEPLVYGAESDSTDMFFRPKWYNLEENMVFIHNESVIYSNTAIVYFKDGTYKIENTYTKEKDTILEKVDKHTIKLHKDETISKIIIFLIRPNITKHIDSLYYKGTKENEMSIMKFKGYKKYTNDLLSYMNTNRNISIEKLIAYGYKYDRDVLKAIQGVFPTIIDIPVANVLVDKLDLMSQKSYIIKFQNRLQWKPILFVNNRLLGSDSLIFKNVGMDTMLINPGFFFKSLNIEVQLNESNLKQVLLDNVSNIKVVLIPMRILQNRGTYELQYPRIYRDMIHKHEVYLDKRTSENADIFKGIPFSNGYMTTEYTDNKYILRRFDGVNICGFGELDFNLENLENPTAEDVYSPKTEFITRSHVNTIINRLEGKVISYNKLWLSNLTTILAGTASSDITENKGMVNWKENNILAWDKYGIECTKHIDVLSDTYLNFDWMYNYRHDSNVDDRMLVHIYSPILKDELLEFDLEIDEDRIDKTFNKGSFNENAIKDPDVRALFNPNEAEEVRETPVVYKSNKKLLGEKILTRYWLGTRGKILSNDFTNEVPLLNGKFVNVDGSLGTIPNINQEFISIDPNMGEPVPILCGIFSRDSIYNTLVESGVNHINTDSVIDSRETYDLVLDPDKESVVGDTIIGSWGIDCNFNDKEGGF